jgi:hypothetical protein
MRILFIILTLIPFLTEGQTFSLSDKTFKMGDVYITYQLLFDFDKAVIRPESYATLDNIADFLTRNDKLVIEVSNHRDTRGSDMYSTCLTCKRAKSIVEYLIAKGIKSYRLIAKGYNDSKHIIPESQIKKLKTKEEVERAHQINRRTEFKILQTDRKEYSFDKAKLKEDFVRDSLGCLGLRSTYIDTTSKILDPTTNKVNTQVLIAGMDLTKQKADTLETLLGKENQFAHRSESRRYGKYISTFQIDHYWYYLDTCGKDKKGGILVATVFNGFIDEIIIIEK